MKFVIRIVMLSALLVGSAALAKEKKPVRAMESANLEQGAWSDIPGVPGAQMKPLHAEPGRAPTDLIIRLKSGVSSPWHSSVESIYTLAGEGEFSMLKTGEKTSAHPGGFIRMPANMVHKVRCAGQQDCVVFVHTALPFDIHIVDEHGKPVAEAKPAKKGK